MKKQKYLNNLSTSFLLFLFLFSVFLEFQFSLLHRFEKHRLEGVTESHDLNGQGRVCMRVWREREREREKKKKEEEEERGYHLTRVL